VKILVIPHLPSQQTRGNSLAMAFADRGHEVHLITWSMPYPLTPRNIADNFLSSWKKEEHTAHSVVVHKVRRLPLFVPPVNRRWFKKQVRSIFEDNAIDVIWSGSYFSETEPPLDLPLFYDVTDDHEAFAEIYGSPLYKLIFKLLNVRRTIVDQIQASRAVFCVSHELVSFAKSSRVGDEKVFLFPNGFEEWALEIPYSEGKHHSLVYVTNFGRWSMLLPLIRVVEELRTTIEDISLTLVGDGPVLAEARQYVREHRLDRWVHFRGVITDRRTLFEEINAHEVCLNISEKNRFRDAASPLKVFEYSSLGKKVVSSELEEVKRLPFENLFFFDNKGFAMSLKAAIETAFASTVDPEAIRAQAAQYSWPVLVGRVEPIFRSELSGS
jgi:glycosyltransferase involved in cell wall biosynthesis